MSSASELRARLQASTGVDFATYADDEFVDTVTGWSGLLAILREAAIAAAVGLTVLLVAILVASTAGLDDDASTGTVIAGVVGGLGTAAFLLGTRLRRRIPEEIGKVFDVSARLAERVSADVSAGRLQVSTAEAARGITVVAAVPALVRVSRKRFPLLGTVLAPVVGSVINRALMRVWPTGKRAVDLDRVGGATQQLEAALIFARDHTVPRMGRAVRWATLPLLLGGGVLISIAVAVLVLSLMVS